MRQKRAIPTGLLLTASVVTLAAAMPAVSPAVQPAMRPLILAGPAHEGLARCVSRATRTAERLARQWCPLAQPIDLDQGVGPLRHVAAVPMHGDTEPAQPAHQWLERTRRINLPPPGLG